MYIYIPDLISCNKLFSMSTALQLTATHCYTLQHAATHCNAERAQQNLHWQIVPMKTLWGGYDE